MNTIAISPEIARLAQRKTSETGTSFYSEIARIIVEEAVVNLDPELGLVVEPEKAVAGNDAVASCLGVNDLVINGKRIDVRAVDSDGRIAIDADLIGTSYLEGGTIVVRLENSRTGVIAGYITPGQWMDTDTVRERAIRLIDRLPPERLISPRFCLTFLRKPQDRQARLPIRPSCSNSLPTVPRFPRRVAAKLRNGSFPIRPFKPSLSKWLSSL
jgi:hypothetical protein